jgi:HD domain
MRVYLFTAEQGRQQKLRFDPELLYVAAAFHDLGLIKKFSSTNERFEVDAANAARQFLTAHNIPEEQVQTVWEAIALHTTRGVTQYMERPSSPRNIFRNEPTVESDPRKIADVILQLANSDEVPVRLILGVDAEKRVQQAEAARAAEADKGRHLTVSTVFEDGRLDR